MHVYLKIKIFPCLPFTLHLLMVDFLGVKCQEELDDYFGKTDEALKKDASHYLRALEVFEITNSSFDSLTSSIRHLFKHIDFSRQDELSSVLYAFPKLRPDLFPSVEERRIGQREFSSRISSVSIRRKDDLFFVFFPTHTGVLWMFRDINFREGKLFYKMVSGFKDLVVVQLTWEKSDAFKGNRTLTAQYRWAPIKDRYTNVTVVTQKFKNEP
ncbi:unnamed protein product [Bemisia tabaci]|uniref:Uncharacterized protein n=1 Tax=Bemisia tabaci TaxID=7038 RepID=A0A9P0F8T0_BEMTA|nr:unnamed protein product [Bemisia tabaci]